MSDNELEAGRRITRSRQRHRSANRNPDFLYFDESPYPEEDNYRLRTSSWSSSGGVAVVELSKKKRSQSKGAIPKKSITKVNKPEEKSEKE